MKNEFNFRILDGTCMPDCCLVCKWGRRYYGRIDCGQTYHKPYGEKIPDVNTLCDLFQRKPEAVPENWFTRFKTLFWREGDGGG